MDPKDIPKVIKILKEEAARFTTPYVTAVSKELKKSPFRVLVSCILSLRTKDSTTRDASTQLFSLADTPASLARLSVKKIEKAIYPAGFYRVKAGVLKELSREIADDHAGRVPETIEELLKLKGVGRKTANLVVTLGYGRPGICVDTHVHRITNRWGFVATKTPEATEYALRKKLHRRYWMIINDLLVAYGQNVCVPVSPRCSVCRIERFCDKTGVERHR
jgi:endonuclease-3